MEKLIKKDVYLTVQEYIDINDYLKNKIYILNIFKQINIIDEDNDFKFYFHIKGEDNRKVSITINNEFSKIMEDKVFSISSNNINDIIGIMVCRHKVINTRKDLTYSFYFNIKLTYDKKYFSSRYNYLKVKQDALKICSYENAYNEIAYADFKNEEEFALATYCLFANVNSLKTEGSLIELYEDKLLYIGVDLEVFWGSITTWIDRDLIKLKNYIMGMTKKEILELMLSYVCFFRGNKYKTEVEISQIGYLLYNFYIALCSTTT